MVVSRTLVHRLASVIIITVLRLAMQSLFVLFIYIYIYIYIYIHSHEHPIIVSFHCDNEIVYRNWLVVEQ